MATAHFVLVSTNREDLKPPHPDELRRAGAYTEAA
jgi:hypothetical protein